MKRSDLAVFDQMPFYFWIKDDDSRYVWVNRALAEAAGDEIVGKLDADLPWSDNSDELVADDRRVLDSGDPSFIHEHAKGPDGVMMALSVCKFVGDFEGQRCSFGVSFVIP